MGMFDPLTGSYSAFSYGLDVHAAAAAEPSIYESVSNIITKGVPLTGLAILNSFANTAIDIGNFFGLENQRLSVEDQVSEEMFDYYSSHKQGIEGAGLVIGSFLPGGLAVKGANAAVKATWLAKSGYSTETLTRATGLLAPLKARIINNAQQEITSLGSLYNGINADKLKLIGLGLGDQALQSLVYEVATLATMKASPLLDKDGFDEIVHNAFSGMIVGGVIGGAIEGVMAASLIKKMVLKSEADTKINELATHLGIGDHLPGDRVAAILASLDTLPEPTTALASRKQATTRDTAMLSARKMMNEAAGPGNEDLSNALLDVIIEGRRNGLLTQDDVYDKLSRLTKLSRIGEDVEVPTGDTFFINKFIGEGRGRARQLRGIDDVITSNAPHADAANSRRYRLAAGVTNIEIAHAGDMIELPTGMKVVKYYTSKEAFEDGADMFIGKRGDVFLNSQSTKLVEIPRSGENRILTSAEQALYDTTGKLPPESKPLTTTPIVLNTVTKNMSTRENISPVVGDYGAPTLVDKGLVYGDKFSAQNAANLITASTEPLEANARFVWAQKAGFSYQDKVNVFDIARMEALFRKYEGAGLEWGQFVEQQTKRGLKLLTAEGETTLPSRASDFINMLRDGKDRIIVEALEKSGVDGAATRSTTDIARMANVPEDYILSGMTSYDIKNFTIPIAQHERVNHIQMIYDLDNVLKSQDGNVVRGALDVQYRVSLAQEAANTAMAKEFGAEWNRFVINRGSADATTEGAGAGLVTSANAGYGTFSQKFERVGRETENLVNKRNQVTHDFLMPHAEVLKHNPVVAAEVGNFVNVRRRTSEDFVFLPPDIAAKYWRTSDTVVLKGSLIRDKNGAVIDWNSSYTPEGFLPAAVKTNMPQNIKNSVELHTFYDLGKQAADFERANQVINRQRIASRENWWTALGMRGKHDPEVLYAPPIDTGKYPYFFFVRPRPGTAFASESPAVVTANSVTELKNKAALMDPDRYQVIYKSENKLYREALGDYEYDRNFSASLVNSDLRKKGVLNDIFPDIRAESILRDYVDFHARQNTRLVRDYVELGNAQLFAELRAMGATATAAETSKTGFVASLLGKTAPNPFNEYINTALAIRDRSNYKLWGDANELLEATASTAFNVAKQAFGAAKRGVIPFDEAAKMSESFGLTNVYGVATDAMKGFDLANRLPPQRYLSQWVSTAHSIIAATALRLDGFNNLINAVSTPVLALAEARSAIARGADMITTEIPGTTQKIPSVLKLLSSGVTSFATNDADKLMLMPLLRERGIVRNASDLHQAMLADLALPMGAFNESAFVTNMRNATDKASKLLGGDLSEEFSRYVPAHMAYKIFGPAGKGLTGNDLMDNIATFVNRVQGNYTASQRPLLFQGPLGSAISLFQTYQFNLMQQVFRYVENGEGKTLAMLAGTQATLFGLQGLPGFQMINNHIVGNAAGNPEHKDIYSTIPNLMDKKTGDYLLYGVLSNWMGAGLYTRGDINPRNITILPINPVDFPAISGSIKMVSAIAGAAETIAKGGDVPASLLLGLEHNGLSRPLTGLAQLIQGYSTTGKGSLIAKTGTGFTASPDSGTMGWSEMFSLANFSRLAGARPLDEAVVMDAMYRKTLYSAKDATRISALGEAVKTHLYNNGTVDSDQLREFSASYAASGGDIAAFGRKINEWTKDANVSVANKIYTTLRQGNMQQIQMMMGGQRLPDFRNVGGIETPPVE